MLENFPQEIWNKISRKSSRYAAAFYDTEKISGFEITWMIERGFKEFLESLIWICVNISTNRFIRFTLWLIDWNVLIILILSKICGILSMMMNRGPCFIDLLITLSDFHPKNQNTQQVEVDDLLIHESLTCDWYIVDKLE